MHTTGHLLTGNDISCDAQVDNSRSLTIVEFQDRHLDDVIKRDTTGEYKKCKEGGYFSNIKKGEVRSFVNIKGEAVAVVGLTKFWVGRYEAWALLTSTTKAEFISIHRGTIELLKNYAGRIECVVADDFSQGKRWARMLGFSPESIAMRKYFPDGRDGIMFARIN